MSGAKMDCVLSVSTEARDAGRLVGDLGRIPQLRRSGAEKFRDDDRALGFDLLSFWRWSASDVVSNATRGVVAEYLVAQAIGVADGVRDEWAAYDLYDPRGIPIEVKSAAYLQSWHQEHLSAIAFRCPKTRAWDPQTNRQSTEKSRQAKVYVFALLANQDQATLDPLDVSQWEFYVIPTATLDGRKRSQHSITLKSLRDLHGEPVAYSDLRRAIGEAAERHEVATGARTSERAHRAGARQAAPDRQALAAQPSGETAAHAHHAGAG